MFFVILNQLPAALQAVRQIVPVRPDLGRVPLKLVELVGLGQTVVARSDVVRLVLSPLRLVVLARPAQERRPVASSRVAGRHLDLPGHPIGRCRER